MNTNFKLLALVAGSALSCGALPPVFAQSTTASVPALTGGMIAPTLDVGKAEVQKVPFNTVIQLDQTIHLVWVQTPILVQTSTRLQHLTTA